MGHNLIRELLSINPSAFAPYFIDALYVIEVQIQCTRYDGNVFFSVAHCRIAICGFVVYSLAGGTPPNASLACSSSGRHVVGNVARSSYDAHRSNGDTSKAHISAGKEENPSEMGVTYLISQCWALHSSRAGL